MWKVATVFLAALVPLMEKLGVAAPAGKKITGTLTDPTGNTSEFASPVVDFGDVAGNDISVTKTDLGYRPPSGSRLAWYCLVKNNGTTASGAVTFSDPLPADVGIVDVFSQVTGSNVGTITESGNTVTISYSTLAPGEEVVITIITGVNPNTPPGSRLVNRARVVSDQPDPNLLNNAGSDPDSI